MEFIDNIKNEESGAPGEDAQNTYMDLRQKALDTKLTQFPVKRRKNVKVYAAVADIPAGGGVATLVCFIDGTVSVYFDSGGGIFGSCQEHEEIKNAGITLMLSSAQALEFLEEADNFDLPEDREASLYLLA